MHTAQSVSRGSLTSTILPTLISSLASSVSSPTGAAGGAASPSAVPASVLMCNKPLILLLATLHTCIRADELLTALGNMAGAKALALAARHSSMTVRAKCMLGVIMNTILLQLTFERLGTHRPRYHESSSDTWSVSVHSLRTSGSWLSTQQLAGWRSAQSLSTSKSTDTISARHLQQQQRHRTCCCCR
jgi:hypothetical protein